MTKENQKTLTLIISHESWKKLKIMSIQKDMSLHDFIKDRLDKIANKLNVDEQI